MIKRDGECNSMVVALASSVASKKEQSLHQKQYQEFII